MAPFAMPFTVYLMEPSFDCSCLTNKGLGTLLRPSVPLWSCTTRKMFTTKFDSDPNKKQLGKEEKGGRYLVAQAFGRAFQQPFRWQKIRAPFVVDLPVYPVLVEIGPL